MRFGTWSICSPRQSFLMLRWKTYHVIVNVLGTNWNVIEFSVHSPIIKLLVVTIFNKFVKIEFLFPFFKFQHKYVIVLNDDDDIWLSVKPFRFF